MKLNLLTEDSPFSFTFSRSFRVGGSVLHPQHNFLRPPKIDQDDAARVLFSSHGEFKIDGKGEELPLEKAGPERDKDAPSILAQGLKRLSGITKDIQSIQQNIEKGEYGSEEQSKAAEDELSKLRAEYDRVINSENFQAAVEAVKKVRAELQGLSEEELYGQLQGKLPLIGSAVQDAAEKKDASVLGKLAFNLDRLLEGVTEGASVESIDRLRKSIEQASSIDNGGEEIKDDSGKFQVILTDLQETVRRLRFLREGVEKGLFSDEQLETVNAEQDQLQSRYREVLRSDGFSEVVTALENVSHLQKGETGTPAAEAFAAEQRGVLGGAFSQLLSNYRFGDINEVHDALFDIGEAAGNLEELASDQLGRLSDTISDALSIVSGDTLQDEKSKVLKRSIDLNESTYDKYKRKYQSDLVDEIEDFFKITEKNAKGAYSLLIEKYQSKGNVLDILG